MDHARQSSIGHVLAVVTLIAVSGCGGQTETSQRWLSSTAADGDMPAAPHWTAYGFDQRNSQVNPDETLLGPSNVSRLKERWRLHMPDGATSTPVIVDGVAYFGGWNGHVYAVDAESGEIRWERRVTQSQVNSTPLVLNDRVYVTAGASLVALSRADGATIYEAALDPHPAAMIWSSPKTVDGMLIIGVASFENGITFEPTFIGSVVALEAESGAEIWRVVTSGDTSFGRCHGGPGASVWSSAAIDEELGLAYIGTGQGFNVPVSNCSDSLLAIDYRRELQGERIRWFVQYTADDVFGAINLFTGPDADVGAAPNLFEVGGRKLVGAGDKGASYRTFDRVSGELVWRKDLDIGPIPSFGGVTTTSAVYQDTLYAVSNHLEVGQFIVDGTHDPSDFSTLYALDTATGREHWRVTLPAPMAGTFAIANGVLYHAVVNRTFYARDLATGDVLWSTQLQNNPGAGPSVVNGRVYISAGMMLTAINPSEGGGYVSSYALDAEALQEREAPADVIEPLTDAQCRDALKPQQTSDACSACLCACDATAAGHCGSCTTLAECSVLFCSGGGSHDEIRDCLATFCNAKLLPSYVFERAVDLAPCTTRCAATCGY
jgi:polyvinyl alcohol dehydrogenase (cytochrome)